MINKMLAKFIRAKAPFPLTEGQCLAVDNFADFFMSKQNRTAFVLRGYAGTGKTTLLGIIVRSLVALNRRVILLAPTGRAAKVLAKQANQPAFTIHKQIYRQKQFSIDMHNFVLDRNTFARNLFIVDESSMISATGGGFVKDSLLADLVRYVYNDKHCRLMLCGDAAQLPPVGEEQSHALSKETLEMFDLDVTQVELDQVVRQEHSSGILWNATKLRQILSTGMTNTHPKVRFYGFADIRTLPGNQLIEALEDCYATAGTEQTIVITRSNKRAELYNNGIRSRILAYEDELTPGDRLIVAKNNYFWLDPDEKNPDFLANGDAVNVCRVRRVRNLYGFRFADVVLTRTDYDDNEVQATAILDTLHSEAPALTADQMQKLFHEVEQDYYDIPSRRERMQKIKQDPYLNALQIKFAYALTCHKAQGGQWKHVFVDQGRITTGMLTPDYFRWLYTAFTRATHTLYLVNWPMAQTDLETNEFY